ncbi:hypothetical protein Hanom_Chr14g01269611 [Helianthus anomalus]
MTWVVCSITGFHNFYYSLCIWLLATYCRCLSKNQYFLYFLCRPLIKHLQSQIVDKVKVFHKIINGERFINEAPKALVLKAVLIPTTIKHMLLYLCVDYFFPFFYHFYCFHGFSDM